MEGLTAIAILFFFVTSLAGIFACLKRIEKVEQDIRTLKTDKRTVFALTTPDGDVEWVAQDISLGLRGIGDTPLEAMKDLSKVCEACIKDWEKEGVKYKED